MHGHVISQTTRQQRTWAIFLHFSINHPALLCMSACAQIFLAFFAPSQHGLMNIHVPTAFLCLPGMSHLVPLLCLYYVHPLHTYMRPFSAVIRIFYSFRPPGPF
ncbi:uncharacterized protein EDB91DRAFT_1166851 [Suillus paluster]|uniref:uncharacterized protein n=1 Tax=Suillus paluster TaxID=48578 RepID=UPI001B860978|nr:uncharacterized protein EDB91DRAFT_1166851 [Suillus paluster]KAG1725991.1 hypothetical protein EDB91DRAFT_1166851 [Suillus paluster]